ncbi:hypothetical protein FOVSG1_004900 [Fusarium oxysporum f. sp. vasinfectum]
MDNNLFINKDSLNIEDLFRQMNRPIILTSNGLMLPGDPSTLQKVSELKAIAIVAGNLLCGLRFESPSGQTGNMVAPSDLGKNAIVYQGDTAGERPGILDSQRQAGNSRLNNLLGELCSYRWENGHSDNELTILSAAMILFRDINPTLIQKF